MNTNSHNQQLQPWSHAITNLINVTTVQIMKSHNYNDVSIHFPSHEHDEVELTFQIHIIY